MKIKKNDWLLFLSSVIYGYLFYEQCPGINFLIFNITLISFLILQNDLLIKNRKWVFVATGALLSSVSILLYGNFHSVFANICSLSILSVLSIRTHSSVMMSLLFSIYSYCSAPYFMIVDSTKRIANVQSTDNPSKRSALFLYIIPLLVTFIFFGLYRGSSSLFRNLTDKINLDFISIGWIFFTLGGAILLYGFFNTRKIKKLEEVEENQSDTINKKVVDNLKIFGFTISILNEFDSGKIMLILLNILLLIVNILDVQFLFFGGILPEGMSYADFVHQGIGSLIISIIIAVAIILWYFRGELNFYKENKILRVLAYLWIAQNLIMIISNIYRNNLYIEEFGLTYKRIGVYIYLMLAIIGLVITTIKIKKIKSNWYLFNVNGFIFYIFLIICCFFNWDMIITNYNISRSERSGKLLDEWYIYSLSESVLPDLYKWSIRHKNSSSSNFKESLNEKISVFNWEQTMVDWRSWNLEAQRVNKDLKEMQGESNLLNPKVK